MNAKRSYPMLFITILFIAALSCNLPSGAPGQQQGPSTLVPVVPSVPAASTNTPAIAIAHLTKPSDTPLTTGLLVYDVDSSGTAPEGRAPYGDSYNIDRFERPFLQNMTYNSNLDIMTFTLSQDAGWYYVSIELIGNNPNDPLGIDYGVELDPDHDGFGDYIVWAHPPYAGWDTSNVQVFADKNHNTGGLSAEKSDAPLQGDGYETLIFDGGKGDDPDLAWVRANAGPNATIQFAFKKSLAGPSFMIGVIADAGLKNVGMLDYNDRFTEEQAGSPIKDKQYYPLKALYAVDNTCWEAFNFKPNGYEPKLCPRAEPAPKKTKEPGPTPTNTPYIIP